MNILLLTDEVRTTSGVTTHIHNLLESLVRQSGNQYYLICGTLIDKERFKDLNVKVVENSDFKHEKRSLRHFFKALIFLRQFCKRNKIDIIHSHTHYAANIAYHTSYTVDVATIQTNHGILLDEGRLDHFKASKYIAINDHIYDYILSHHIAPKGDISFIRCGIPVPERLPKENHAAKIGFLAASRFVHDKGIDVYIRAVSLLPEDYKNKAEFYLAGEGELENDLHGLNQELKAGIIFLGNLKSLGVELSRTHVFVNASRGNSEGFPAVITEAGALGNLVITSDFYGLKPVFEEDKDGLVFKSGDASDLSEKMKFAIDNYDDMTPCITNFHNKVKELFALDKMAESHLHLYRECIQK